MIQPQTSTVAGYRIEGLLGRGGMGAVYRAIDVRLGRPVALKLLAPELASDQGFRARFSAESRLAATLDHPHIVPIYEAGETDGVLFIAMRFVDGADLETLIRRDGRLAPARAIDLLTGIADALDSAHERALLHRDVKPANILVTTVGHGPEHTYLTDFGLSRQLDGHSRLTRTGQIVGSADYLAPEQIEGRSIDRRADVYALGCVLYAALTGRPPYQRETELATLYAHIQAPIPRPSAVDPGLAAFDSVIATGMAKAVDDRYASAGELLMAAQDALRREPGAAQRATRPEPLSVPASTISSVGEAIERRITSPVLVNRVAEVGQLETSLARAKAGKPSVVIIGGDAGIGKTRLMSEFAARADQSGAWVFMGACLDIAEGGLPYAPFSEAFRRKVDEADEATIAHLLGPSGWELARIVPVLAGQAETKVPTGGGVAQARFFELFLGFTQRLTAMAPVVLLVLEDIQWADRSTRDMLMFLARNLRQERIVIVATYRTDAVERGHPLLGYLAEVERQDAVHRMTLGPLDKGQVRAQLKAIAGRRPPPELIDQIFAHSEGNPFFAEELFAAGGVADGEVPPSLQDLLLARLGGLGERAQSLLRVAAVVGREIDADLLETVAGMPASRLEAAVREAVSHGILIADPKRGKYRFRHGLFREAAYADLMPGERRRLHAKVAEVLTARPIGKDGSLPVALAELAHHWYAAGRKPEALALSIEAGRAARAVFAHDDALGQFERAIELWPDVPDAEARSGLHHVALLQETAEVGQLAGVLERSLELTMTAIAEAERGDEAESEGADDHRRLGVLYGRLGRFLWLTGEVDSSIDAFRQAVELVPGQPPTAERAEVLAGLGTALTTMRDFREAILWSREALASARAAGAATQEARALSTLGYDLVSMGEVEEGLEDLSKAQRIADGAGAIDMFMASTHNLYVALKMMDRLDDALAVAVDGIAAAKRLGLDRHWGPELRADAALVLFQLGRWDEASRMVDEGLDLSAGTLRTFFLHQAGTRLATARGDFAASQEHLDGARRLAEGGADLVQLAHQSEGAAELALSLGRLDEARSIVVGSLERLRAADEVTLTAVLLPLAMRIEADRAALGRSAGSESEVEEARRRASDYLARASVVKAATDQLSVRPASLEAALLTTHAEWSRAEGRSDPQLWAAAAAEWESVPMPFEAAYGRYRQAEATLAAGGGRAAVTLLREAFAAASALEAQPLEDAIAQAASEAQIDLTAISFDSAEAG